MQNLRQETRQERTLCDMAISNADSSVVIVFEEAADDSSDVLNALLICLAQPTAARHQEQQMRDQRIHHFEQLELRPCHFDDVDTRVLTCI